MNMKTEIATKEAAVAAGLDMMSRVTPAQQEKLKQVINWIKTLKDVPSTTDAHTTFRVCCREWYAVKILGEPQGTGDYNLETL